MEHVQITTNFNSAYNILSNPIPQSSTYIPLSSSTSFSKFVKRSSSPLLHRCKSPPSRQPILTDSGPKFNFDLYKMSENINEYNDYSLPSYRPISPSSPSTVFRCATGSSLSFTASKSQTVSKLRRINDDLCHTLAKYELIDQPQQSSATYHIHHYPLSQYSYQKCRSRPMSKGRSSSTELEVVF